MPTTLAIIPARGGSKSIPLKNLAPVAGRPLIAYTIEAARAARSITRLIVSTDSLQIAETSRSLSADVPFLRPPELARDDAPGIAPILHAIQWLDEHEHQRFDYILCLQPTSPFRTADDIESAIRLAIDKNADAVVSVTPADQHPHWMKQLTPDGRLIDLLPTPEKITRRQDLPPAYALNGAIYLARTDILLQRQTWYTDKTYALVMPPERSLDIDTPWDLHLADLILKDRHAQH